MKKVLNLIITYFTFLILGIIIGAIFYSFYLNVLKFISGHEIHFFSNEELLEALFYISYCMVFLVCPFVCYYRIRHAAGFSQTIAYIIICLFTWLLFFPGVKHLNNYYNRHYTKSYNYESLSKGYFRKADGKVYYFTEDFGFKGKDGIAASAVIIDTSEEGGVEICNVIDTPNMVLNKEAKPYKELQVKQTFDNSAYNIPFSFHILIDAAKDALDGGILTYLGFLSMALLLCSVYGLTNLFEWRLLNTSLLYLVSSAIMVFNTMFYLPVTEQIKEKLSNNKFYDFLGEYINEPLLVTINIVFALAILVLGIVRFIVRNHRKKGK